MNTKGHIVQSPAKRFIAFIDLLGIRDMARAKPDLYQNTIHNFQCAIEACCPTDNGPSCEIYGFSDSVFCEFEQLRALLEFLAEVRCHMLLVDPSPVFFRAAVIEGALDAAQFTRQEKKKLAKSKLKAAFNFGKEAARAFGLQEETKGIGIHLAPELVEQEDIRDLVFQNYYYVPGTAQPYCFFFDLRLRQRELTTDLWRTTLRAFFKAKVRSKKFGRYYLPLIASYINEIDINHIGKRHGAMGDDWDPQEILGYFANGDWEAQFRDVSGGDGIYFLLLEKLRLLASDVPLKEKDVRMRLRNRLIRIGRLRRDLHTVPPRLLSEDGKAMYLNELERHVFATKKSDRRLPASRSS